MADNQSRVAKDYSSSRQKALKVILPASATAKSKEECKRSLVVKIVSEKNVGYGALMGTLSHIWKCNEGYTIIGLSTNLYQVKFDLEIDVDRVLMGCPWYNDSQLLIIKKWRPGIEKDEGAFNLAPIWVQIWGLLLEWVSEAAGEEICEQLGTVLKKQVVFGGSKYGKFVRCLVEMDVSQSLQQGLWVSQDGTEKWVSFKYEHVSLYCAYCGVIGHKASCYYTKVIDQNAGVYKEEAYGPELLGTPIKSVSDSPLVPGKSQLHSVKGTTSIDRSPENDEPGNVNTQQGPVSRVASPPKASLNPWPSYVKQQPVSEREKPDRGKNRMTFYSESSHTQSGPNVVIVEEELSPPSLETLMIEWHADDSNKYVSALNAGITIKDVTDILTEVEAPKIEPPADDGKKRKMDARETPFPRSAQKFILITRSLL